MLLGMKRRLNRTLTHIATDYQCAPQHEFLPPL